jgi:hypothetical protein
MNECEFCHAPLLSITQVCPNCKREQPPYPPILPGGGGDSYKGWAAILLLLGAGLLILGIAMFFQGPYANYAAYTYGTPDSYINGNNPQWIMLFGDTPVYPGWGYLIFFGGFTLVLWLWAFVSYNRGNRIDKANAAILRSLRRNNQAH